MSGVLMEEVDFDLFLDAFPFGNMNEREGEYVVKVEGILKGLPTEDQSLLMELLDLQWTVVVEQLGLINTFKENPSRPGRADAAMARLQINSNIRREHGLPGRDMRSALLKIRAGDLLDHIEAVKGSV
jgi:hypothetical protein